jgi:hypothetical protein
MYMKKMNVEQDNAGAGSCPAFVCPSPFLQGLLGSVAGHGDAVRLPRNVA